MTCRSTGLWMCLALALACPAGRRAGADPGGGPREAAARLVRADRPAEAAAMLRAHLGRARADDQAWLDLGTLERRRCDLAEARAAFAHVLARDLYDPGARAGLAEVCLAEGDPHGALREVSLGFATPAGRREGALWRARTLALIRLEHYDLALEAAGRGLAVAPGDALVTSAYARAAFRAGDMAAAGRAYRRATRLDPIDEEANLRLGSGFGPPMPGAPWLTGEEGRMFDAAVAALDRSDLPEAGSLFRALCRRAPDDFKYRLGLGLVRREVRLWNEIRLGGASERLYLHQPRADVAGVAEFVLPWEGLSPLARAVVLVSLAPARTWLPRLREAGATHEILPLAESLTDAPSRRMWADQRTFDGRDYGHLRGAGGRNAATGVEKLRTAARFAFNTFAHEFAHQLLRFGFSEALQAQVEALYERAVETQRCLDYYAASNVDEYFAQGYEALMSLRKRGCLRETARHTRAELRDKDPDLYTFLLEHLDLSHETPEALDAFNAAVPP